MSYRSSIYLDVFGWHSPVAAFEEGTPERGTGLGFCGYRCVSEGVQVCHDDPSVMIVYG